MEVKVKVNAARELKMFEELRLGMVASAAGTSIKVAVNEATATAEAARDAAVAAAAEEEVFKPNKFSTIPHTFLSSSSTRLSFSALISRKYKFVLTNCIRSVCLRWGKAWSVCVECVSGRLKSTN